MKKTGSFALSFILTLLLAVHSVFAQVELGKPEVFAGESIWLKVTYQDKKSVDLSALSSSYKILSRMEKEQVILINDRVSSTRYLELEIMPKNVNPGKFKIPSLSVDGKKTAEIPYTVKEASAAGKDDLILQGEVLKNSGVEGGQVIYKLTVLDSLGLLSGNFDVQKGTPFLVEQLNESDSYRITLHGKPYRAYQRLYALFPEKSGKLDLPVFSFEGYSRERTKQFPENPEELLNAGSMDLLLGEGVQLHLGSARKHHALQTSKETLQFDKRPKEFDGKWFIPAEKAFITMRVEDIPTFEVGTPFLVTVEVRVHGLLSSQIPPITLADTRDFRIYPEPEGEHTQYDGDNLVGMRSRAFKFVPTHSGALALPFYKLTFYNTLTKDIETVSSKAATLSIKSSPGVKELEVKEQPLPSPDTSSFFEKKASLPVILVAAGIICGIFISLSVLLFFFIFLPRIRFNRALKREDYSDIQQRLLRMKKVSTLSALKEKYPKKRALIERLESATFGGKKDALLIRDLKKAFLFVLFVLTGTASLAQAEPSQAQIGEARYYGYLAGMAYGCKDVNLKRFEQIVGTVMRNRAQSSKDAQAVLIDYTNAKKEGLEKQGQGKFKCTDFSQDFAAQKILKAEVYPDGSVLMPDGKWVLARGVSVPPKKRQ